VLGEKKLLELVYAASRTLAQARTAAAGLGGLLATLAENLGCEVGLGWRLDAATDTLKLAAATPCAAPALVALVEAAAQVRLARGQGLAGAAWESLSPFLAGDAEGGPGSPPPHLPALRACQLGSWLLVPVQLEGQLLAVVELGGSQPSAPAPGLLPTLEAIATQLAQFLEREAARERARAALEAAESERAWLYSLLMQAPFPLLITRGPEHRIELVNPGFAAVLGPDPVGRPLSEAHGTLCTPEAQRLQQQAYDTGETTQLPEFPAPRGPGQPPRYSTSVWTPLRDQQGRVSGMMSLNIDVTAQVQARQRAEELAREVEQQRHWLETILEHLPEPLGLFDASDGTALFANAAARAIGFRKEDWSPEKAPAWRARYPMTDASGQAQSPDRMPLARAVRGEEVTGEAMHWQSPHGPLDLLVSGRRVPAMFGHPPTVVIAAVDVTRLREVEAELQRQLDMRDDFLSTAAHELRTPLTPLLLHVQNLLEGLSGPVPITPQLLAEKLGITERQVVRIGHLVEGLLDVTRLRAGRLQLDLRPGVDLAEVTEEVIERLASQAQRAGSVIERRLEPVRGRWDRLRLEGVVENLLSNALKYGAGQPVSVEVRAAGDQATLRVVDRGIGIDPSAHERIFERFERAVSARHYGGLGVGLWIVRNVVTAMRGTVAVHSQPGHGATFEVALPL
jgi:signal transduction histidine kinase